MRARDAILARVRSALSDVPAGMPADEDTPVPWEYGRPTAMPDVLERFVERVEDYKATVDQVSPDVVAGAVATALLAHGASTVVLPAGIPDDWREAIATAGMTPVSDDPLLDNAALDAVSAVVTGAAVGAAESGTIVLDHGPDQGRRALSLVPDVHVCVIRASQVVSDVPEAVARLAGAVTGQGPMTWISGGSATSDIELSRVEGVHGPRTLRVVLVLDA